MEVGAVKQAFNNELIRLKKNLNQARIQIIHKLTRKAKTLTEKKVPEKLKEKLKRKAESAVNEVLIIKKIKIRDLAKFMLTHTGELNSFLNKPNVDTEKACARLLLHRILNDKYKFIRNKFASIPINDLLMSREERRKIKKEAKEKQNNKKKGNNSNDKPDIDVEMASLEKGKEFSDDDSEVSGDEIDETSDNEASSNYKDENMNNSDDKEIENHNDLEEQGETSDENDVNPNEIHETSDHDDNSEIEDDDDETPSDVGKFVKLQAVEEKPDTKKQLPNICNEIPIIAKDKPIKKMPIVKKVKDVNKNKNLNEKLVSRKFKKEEDTIVTENKVVDPFFITATGESYLSVAEPRAPDEFKEIHRQGNRQLRRAVMFGHSPKIKQRYDDFKSNNRFNKPNNFEGNYEQRRNSDRFNRNDKNERFNQINAKNEKNSFHNNNKTFVEQPEAKLEKLHPSWEAKKKQSGILPYQGKKIVFGDN